MVGQTLPIYYRIEAYYPGVPNLPALAATRFYDRRFQFARNMLAPTMTSL